MHFFVSASTFTSYPHSTSHLNRWSESLSLSIYIIIIIFIISIIVSIVIIILVCTYLVPAPPTSATYTHAAYTHIHPPQVYIHTVSTHQSLLPTPHSLLPTPYSLLPTPWIPIPPSHLHLLAGPYPTPPPLTTLRLSHFLRLWLDANAIYTRLIFNPYFLFPNS